MYSKIALILSGNAVTALLTLLRNLFVARLIPVEEYGIAATFAVVMTFVEMLSAFGLQQLVIQSKTNDPKWQAALQGFQILRAAVSAAVLFLAADLIAGFLGVPEVAWAYQVLALAPLLNGIVHLDVFRLNREMVYLPGVLTTTVPAFVSLLAVWPLYLVFGDYRVMLWSVVLQFALMAAISIMISERAYKIRFDGLVIREAMTFGWPLLLNGMLLFAVLNGEKLIIGRELGMAALGVFAMGFTLTLTPTLVVAKSVQSFLLPQLSAVQEDDDRFQPLARTTIEASLFNGALLVVAVVLVGEPFVALVLGEKFAALGPLMVWLAILHAVRVFKTGSAVASLARGLTGNAVIGNSFRIFSLPLSWWVAVETGDLLTVIWIALAGETLGFAASLIMVRYRAGVRLRRLWPALLSVCALLLAAALYAGHGTSALAGLPPRWSLAVGTVVFLGLSMWTMRDTRAYLGVRQMAKFED